MLGGLAMELINRKTAMAKGLKRYFTGEACNHGHVAERLVSDRSCIPCSVTKTNRQFKKKLKENPDFAARQKELGRHRMDRWRQRNPEKGKERERAHRARNPNRALKNAENANRWNKQNRVKATESLRTWKRNNPEQIKELRRVAYHRRRTRILGNGGHFTTHDIAKLFERQHGRCANPNCMAVGVRLEIDHIMPVSRGGSSDPHNLQLLCHDCNDRKRDKHPDEWRKLIAATA
jgi:5-methylcytosine-specific restriction endonuclease McrA